MNRNLGDVVGAGDVAKANSQVDTFGGVVMPLELQKMRMELEWLRVGLVEANARMEALHIDVQRLNKVLTEHMANEQARLNQLGDKHG